MQASILLIIHIYYIKYGALLGFSDTDKTDNLTLRLFMIISHVKIIAFQTIIIHCLWIFYIARKDCSLYITNRIIHARVRVKHDISLVRCAHS